MSYREQLGEMLRKKSLVRGEVILSSGEKSDYYFDCKLTTLDPQGAFLTGQAILEKLEEIGIHADAIGGMSMGADPVVSATVVVSHLEGKPLPGFLIRKEPKKHGQKKQMEGLEGPNRKVVIVDEVCTTGKATRDAIAVAETLGHKVVAVVVLVDREEGGSEELRRNYNYHTIFTARELMRAEERTAGATGRVSPPAGAKSSAQG